MAEDKVPAQTNRPRLLSDISENPMSESAIPEEYNVRRSSCTPASQASSHHLEGQRGFHRAPNPGVIGQPLQRTPSSNFSGQVDRLQPLSPLNPQRFQRSNENRRSTPNPLPAFTTSLTGGEPMSPSQTQDAPFKRSFSQTSLASGRNFSRPRTPTPASGGVKGKGKAVPGLSSPSSPSPRITTPHPYGKPSVKHLTCFWWKVKGICRFAEDDCLYAHRETGLLADAPRQVTPGEPAKAGRQLEKAMENFRFKRNLSTSSLNASMNANPSTPEGQSTSAPATTPTLTEALEDRISSLQADNNFLRGLVEQSGKEKSILMTTIEGLQKEISNLNTDVDFLKEVVNEMQEQRRASGGTMPDNVNPDA